MRRSLREHRVVSYEVRSEDRVVLLHLQNRDGRPPERTQVVFTGVTAYRFADDGFEGNALLDVVEVPVAEAATSLGQASVEPVEGARGFAVRAASGLAAWVIAKTAAIVPEPIPVPPPAHPPTRGVYALAPDGSRTLLDAIGIAVSFGDGRRLTAIPSRHPGNEGAVIVRAETERRGGAAAPRPDAYALLRIEPEGGNSMRAQVTTWLRGARAERPMDAGAATRKRYLAIREDEESPVDAAGFLFDLGEGRALRLDAPGRPPVDDHVRFEAGPPLTKDDLERVGVGGGILLSTLLVGFSGANVLDLRVSRPYVGHEITAPPPKSEP